MATWGVIRRAEPREFDESSTGGDARNPAEEKTMVYGRSSAAMACALLILGFLFQPLRGEVTASDADQAQEGTVVGRVLGADTGRPLAGAQVSIVELQIGAVADEEGEYRIDDVPAGSYTLQVRSLGFEPVERSIQVQAGQVLTVDVRLEVEPIKLGDLIVTPRRQAEIAREVPITQTVFDSEQMEEADINRPGDFLELTPNATFISSQNTGTGAFISLRGIAQQRNTQTPVAVVIDDVLDISPLQFDQALYDIERVEVIKGPEGGLYGRNAIAGAILVRTREPTNQFEGFLRGGAGQGGQVSLTGAYGGPIVEDKLLFRAAGRFVQRDGFFKNTTLNQTQDLMELANVRVKLRWNASPRFRADFKGTVDRSQSNPGQWIYQPALLGADNKLADGDFPFDFSTIDSNRVDRSNRSNNFGFGERNIDHLSMRLSYDLDVARLESISSYNNIENFQMLDQFPYTASTTTVNAFGPIDGTQTQWKTTEGWSHELRIISKRDQRFRWQLGNYFLSFDRFKSTSVGEDRGSGIIILKKEPRFDSSTNPTTSWLADDNDNQAWAVFANAEVDVVEGLSVSGALRYDRETREQVVSELNTVGAPGSVNKATFDKVQPKFRIGYKRELANDVVNFVNLYGSWGIGFRSGEFNQNGVAEAAAGAGIEGVRDEITEEDAETFEVGFKSRWASDRVSLEAAFFRTDDEGQPFFLFIGEVGAQVLVNIPEADITGFESTLLTRLARGLDAYAAFGYTDTEIKEFPVNPDAVGGQIPLVPKTTLNIGSQYRGKLSSDFGILARIDYERRGKMAWTAINETPRDPIDLVNLQGGLEFGKWTARLIYENVTDEVYNSEFVKGGFAWPAPPDRWRLELKTNL
ncbi:MAG: TonB-dependent receptor [Gemmatimonadota bacterium]